MGSNHQFVPVKGDIATYKGITGVVNYVDQTFFTLCIRNKEDGMIGDTCLVIHDFEYHYITPAR